MRLITGTVRDKTVTDRLALSKQQKENLQQIFGWAIPRAIDRLRFLTFLPHQPEPSEQSTTWGRQWPLSGDRARVAEFQNELHTNTRFLS